MNNEIFNWKVLIISMIVLILLVLHASIDQNNNNIINISTNGFNLQAIIGLITFTFIIITVSLSTYELSKRIDK